MHVYVFFLMLAVSTSGINFSVSVYRLFSARTFSSDVLFEIDALNEVDCLYFLRSLTHDDVDTTIAVYNKTSKSCRKHQVPNQTLFLLEHDDANTMAMWNTNACSLFTQPDSVYYERTDKNLNGFDITIQAVSSRMECAHICDNNHGNAAKGFMYKYNQHETCFCKRLSAEEYIRLGHSISYIDGYSYYDRLC